VVGTKDGFVPRTVDVVVGGGDRQKVDVTLIELGATGEVKHRWAVWKPWVVFGGGLVVAGFGTLLELKAAADMRAYDRNVALQCPSGCPAGTPVDDSLKSTAALEDKVAIVVIATGIATAATGAVLMYMNRGKTVYPDAHGAETQVGVVPLVGGGAAVTLSGSF
jgi:hypothetical protein